MRVRPVIAALGVTFGLALGASLLPASPASAWVCSAGYSCLWEDANFTTPGTSVGSIPFAMYIPNLTSHSYGGTTLNGNNSASSVVNNGNSDTAYYYVDGSCNGANFSRSPGGGQDMNLSDTTGPLGFNNKLSSTRFSSYSTTTC